MALRTIALPFLAAAATACQPVPSGPPAPAAPSTALQGQARAETLCSGCHAVGRSGTSSNRNAPPFHSIINQVDLRPETVSAWLRDAHNYPSEMNFSLNERDVNLLVAYMISLRDPNYQRAPD